jgi:opacity protein-like surface antigen
MRKLVSLAIFLLIAGAAWAQIPTKGNVFFGYSYENTAISQGDGGSLNGWEATLEGKFLPWVGLLVDVDGHYGSRNYVGECGGVGCGASVSVSEHNILFGPRVSVQVKKFRPFAEALFGVSHVDRNSPISDSNTCFSDGVGGGLDYKVAGPIAVRAQLDWINTRFYNNGQNAVRFSTGISFHF